MQRECFTADTGCASYFERDVAMQDETLHKTRRNQQVVFPTAAVSSIRLIAFSQNTSNLGSTSAYICSAVGAVTAQSCQTETINYVKVSDPLKPEEREQIRCSLKYFSDIFSNRPKVARVKYHHIELTSSKAVSLTKALSHTERSRIWKVRESPRNLHPPSVVTELYYRKKRIVCLYNVETIRM